ncbi:MHO_4530 family protein [Candidatus Mycoplasma pogonae]
MLFFITKYFLAKKKNNSAFYFSIVVDKKEKKLRVADFYSMKNIKKFLNNNIFIEGKWISYENFVKMFLPKDAEEILSHLSENRDLNKVFELKKSEDGVVSHFKLELHLENNAFIIMKKAFANKKNSKQINNNLKIEPIEKLLKTKNSNVVFYSFLLNDEKDSKNIVQKIIYTMEFSSDLITGIFTYEKYLIFAIKEDLNFFNKPQLKKWLSLVNEYPIYNYVNCFSKLVEKKIPDKKTLEEFKYKIEYSMYKTIKDKVSDIFTIESIDKEEFEIFKTNLNFFKNEFESSMLNLKNILIKKEQADLKSVKIASIKLPENYNFDFLNCLTFYKTKLNLMYLKKNILNNQLRKIIFVNPGNLEFIKKNKLFYKKNFLLLAAISENYEKIINLEKDELNVGILINQKDDFVFDLIKKTNLKIIVIGKEIASRIEETENMMWLSYLNEIAEKLKITVIYHNPDLNVEDKVKKQIKLVYWFTTKKIEDKNLRMHF